MIDFEALEAILERVKKPARYLGGEWNSVVKDENVVELKVLLSYPDAYELGVSNQGVQILYTVLNGRPEYLCERAYAPWPDMEAELRAAGMPLFSLESKRTGRRRRERRGSIAPDSKGLRCRASSRVVPRKPDRAVHETRPCKGPDRDRPRVHQRPPVLPGRHGDETRPRARR